MPNLSWDSQPLQEPFSRSKPAWQKLSSPNKTCPPGQPTRGGPVAMAQGARDPASPPIQVPAGLRGGPANSREQVAVENRLVYLPLFVTTAFTPHMIPRTSSHYTMTVHGSSNHTTDERRVWCEVYGHENKFSFFFCDLSGRRFVTHSNWQ